MMVYIRETFIFLAIQLMIEPGDYCIYSWLHDPPSPKRWGAGELIRGNLAGESKLCPKGAKGW